MALQGLLILKAQYCLDICSWFDVISLNFYPMAEMRACGGRRRICLLPGAPMTLLMFLGCQFMLCFPWTSLFLVTPRIWNCGGMLKLTFTFMFSYIRSLYGTWKQINICEGDQIETCVVFIHEKCQPVFLNARKFPASGVCTLIRHFDHWIY